MTTARRVLILQSDSASAKDLTRFFSRRGDKLWLVASAAQAKAILEKERPDLALLDLHTPENAWPEILARIQNDYPNTGVIITHKKPDVRSEQIAREQGAWVLLRAPYTAEWIERALARLKAGPGESTTLSPMGKLLPRVRVPMLVKITFPYVLLALIFLLASAYLVGRYILETIQDRFTNQLIDAGKLSADWMVREENRILGSLRLLANTDGLPEALLAGDANRLREIALPIAINYKEESVEFLALDGSTILSLHHRPEGRTEEYDVFQGGTQFAGSSSVQKVLSQQQDQKGDKYAEVNQSPLGAVFYISGPVFDPQGNLVGVVLVGKLLDTLVHQMRSDTLAQLTIYGLDGQRLATTLFLDPAAYPLSADLALSVLQRQDQESTIRDMKVASADYAEILGPWEARKGEDLGVVGVALPQNFFVRPRQITSLQAILAVVLAFIGVITIGVVIARQITYPLSKVVEATTAVAEGDFQIKVPVIGNDEVMVLAHAFNYMVTGLQEGSIYRDLLGRTVSPEVREAMRLSFASGGLKLEGQNTVATVLMSDIRNFTSFSEKEQPTTILTWLNEYFSELVPVVTKYGGVIDKFEGDAMLAFFGILPKPLSPEESAYHACKASIEMLEMLDKINARRIGRGDMPLKTGIGINTGNLIAGGLGTADRLNYTIIGDTVNSTNRIQELTREFTESGVVVSESTLTAMKTRRSDFRFEPLGEHELKGKSEAMWVYRLWPITVNSRVKAILPISEVEKIK